MIEVAVAAEDACGSCKVKALCGMEGKEIKIISVFDPKPDRFKVNDDVAVGIGTIMGIKAAFFAYVLPFLAMFATLTILSYTGLSEAASGLLTLGVAAAYYIVLYFLRDKIGREITFKIEKVNG